MRRRAGVESPECFYCGALVSGTAGYGDHFPVPQNAGGTATVPCCMSCHDMKDRYQLLDWPSIWTGRMVQGFYGLMTSQPEYYASLLATDAYMDVDLFNSKVQGRELRVLMARLIRQIAELRHAVAHDAPRATQAAEALRGLRESHDLFVRQRAVELAAQRDQAEQPTQSNSGPRSTARARKGRRR